MANETQDRMRRTLRLLLAARDMNARQLGALIGMSSQQMSDRMQGRTRWTIDDLDAMSNALHVSGGVWFDEPEKALTHLETAPPGGPGPEARNRCSSPARNLTARSVDGLLARMRDAASPIRATSRFALADMA